MLTWDLNPQSFSIKCSHWNLNPQLFPKKCSHFNLNKYLFLPKNAHIGNWTHNFENAHVGSLYIWVKTSFLHQCGSRYFCITFLGDFKNYGKVFWLAHVNYHVWIESSRQITINFSGLLLDENGEFLLNYIIAASVHLVESRSLLSRNAHFSTSNQCHALFFTTS